MTPRYTSTGKQVLCDGAHFADARDPDAAAEIVGAMEAIPFTASDQAEAIRCYVASRADPEQTSLPPHEAQSGGCDERPR